MNLRPLALFALPFALLLSVACGDGAGDSATPTAASDLSPFGPGPTLGGNIVQISPEHAATVSRASTVTTNPLNPKGVCVNVSFANLPQYGQSFRFIVDQADVTAAGDTTWIIATTAAPKDGTICFAPPDGLAPGRHTAAIGVQDPNNLSAPFKQTVAWAFDVSE